MCFNPLDGIVQERNAIAIPITFRAWTPVRFVFHLSEKALKDA